MNDMDVFARFFGVLARGQTYLNLLYLLLSFPLGILYFVFLVIGLALGFSLLVVLVGLVILAATVACWWLLADFERQMAIQMLHVDIPPMRAQSSSDVAPAGRGLWEQTRAYLSNPVTWKALLYLFAKFPLGILSFVLLVTLLATTAVLLATPLLYKVIPIGIMIVNGHAMWLVDTPGEAAATFIVGLGLLFVSLNVLNGLAWVSGRFACLMLGDPRAEIVLLAADNGLSAAGGASVAPVGDILSSSAIPTLKEKFPMPKRSNIAAALVLIAMGVWFLAIELFPNLKELVFAHNLWPLSIIGIGALLGLIGLLLWVPGLMIPACIVGGIGGLLYWQTITGNWESWAYVWALIPGFAGVGTLISGVMSRNRGMIRGGFWTILNSLVIFAIFAALLGGNVDMARYWPVALIAVGVLLLLEGLFRRK